MTRRRRKRTKATSTKNKTRLPEQHHIICGVFERRKKPTVPTRRKPLGIWACNVPVREHQGSAVRACNVPVRNTRLRPFGPVMSPSGTPGLGRSGRNVPVRNTRPRDHDARPDPRSAAPCPRRPLAKTRQKLLLTAPEGAGGVLSCSCLTRDAILP